MCVQAIFLAKTIENKGGGHKGKRETTNMFQSVSELTEPRDSKRRDSDFL